MENSSMYSNIKSNQSKYSLEIFNDLSIIRNLQTHIQLFFDRIYMIVFPACASHADRHPVDLLV